ncbi:UNVERIFIED_CONTAM: protein, chloroplastic [Sesamum latifolium]|uniref:Protein, chloroplastic n=1 Tax=Sesamum latifolium TaxID=2727402 RepID=A0AAW2SNI7_9LAMI
MILEVENKSKTDSVSGGNLEMQSRNQMNILHDPFLFTLARITKSTNSTNFSSEGNAVGPRGTSTGPTSNQYLEGDDIINTTAMNETTRSVEEVKNAHDGILESQNGHASSSSSLMELEPSSSVNHLESLSPSSPQSDLSSAFKNFSEALSCLLVNPLRRLKSEIGVGVEDISTELVDEIGEENTSGIDKMIPVVLDSVHFKGGTLMLLAYGDTEPRLEVDADYKHLNVSVIYAAWFCLHETIPFCESFQREMEVATGHVKFQNHYGRVHVQLSGNCKMWRSGMISEDGGWLSSDVYVDIIEQKWHANLKISNLFVPLFERIVDLPITWSKGRASGELDATGRPDESLAIELVGPLRSTSEENLAGKLLSFSLQKGHLKANAYYQPLHSANLEVRHLPLDELELASLRGAISRRWDSVLENIINIEISRTSVELSEKKGPWSAICSPAKIQWCFGEALDVAARWSGDVITVERAILEQSSSKYELQGEYVLPGSRDRSTAGKETGSLFQRVMTGHLGSMISSMGRWRMRLEVPNAEIAEMLPLARLLSRSSDPAVQSRSKVRLKREHLNIAKFEPDNGLDPMLDLALVGSEWQFRIQSRASKWQEKLVVTSTRSGEQDVLSTTEAARVFESQLAESILEGDGQLAFKKLATATLETLMPRIEGKGEFGQARWRLVYAPQIPSLLSVDPTVDPLKSLASNISFGTEVEVQLGKRLQASVVRQMKDSEMAMQWTLIYQLTSRLRVLLQSAPSKRLLFEYYNFTGLAWWMHISHLGPELFAVLYQL